MNTNYAFRRTTTGASRRTVLVALLTAVTATGSLLVATTPRAAYAQGAAGAIQAFYKDLNLTEDQKTKIKPIMQDTAKQMMDVHKDTSLSKQEAARKSLQIQGQAMQKIKPILTPDQTAKLKGAMQKFASAAIGKMKGAHGGA